MLGNLCVKWYLCWLSHLARLRGAANQLTVNTFEYCSIIDVDNECAYSSDNVEKRHYY